MQVLKMKRPTYFVLRLIRWVESNLINISDDAERQRQRFLFHDQPEPLSAFWPFVDESHWKQRHATYNETDLDETESDETESDEPDLDETELDSEDDALVRSSQRRRHEEDAAP